VLEVAAGAHAQHVARHGNWPPLPVDGYPGVLHVDSLAKYAVAFLRNTLRLLKRVSKFRRSPM
jgi:hypothetical protein